MAAIPFLWLASQWQNGWLGSKPTTNAIHQSGDWAIRFLLLSLLVSPLRRIANWPKLIMIRRMLGLTALFYLILHFILYIIDQKWNLSKVASEIWLRVYLTIGFAALLGTLALGATSFDSAIKKMGGIWWNRLHMLVYPIAILGLLHFAMQTKLDATQALTMSGFFLLLMFYRFMHRFGAPTNMWTLGALAIISAIAAAGVEAAWYASSRGIDLWAILPSNWLFDLDLGTRPSWWTLGAGLVLLAIYGLRKIKLKNKL
jgi:methionine sulfoxide reductase heme-binding subunit